MNRHIVICLMLLVASLESRGESPSSLSASGRVITIAGTGAVGFSGDGGPATNATLSEIGGLAFGPDGTLYFADNGNLRVRAIDPATGIVRTIAGSGNSGEEGNNGPATNASIAGILGLATDRTRNALYLTDWPNHWLRKVDLSDGMLTAYAGTGRPGPFGGDGGLATVTRLSTPIGAVTDAAGRLAFIDLHHERVRRVDPVTGIITTIGGTGILGQPSGDGGLATSAVFGSPFRLTGDAAGNIFLRDGDPNGTWFSVRRIDATTGIITTIVGGGTNSPGTGVATNMFFKNIAELAVNDSGELFVATPYQIFKLNIATGIIAPYAGADLVGFGNEGDPALDARFAYISAIAVVPGGGLVIGDSDNARIRYIAPESINLSGDAGQTSFTLPWVSGLVGDLIVENNPNLTNIGSGSLVNIDGVISIGGNSAASEVDLGSITSAGSVSIIDNTAAVVVSLGDLESVAGEVEITGNTGAVTIDVGSLTGVGGAISLGNNTAAAEVDLSSVGSAGSVTITDNTSATTISLGATNVASEVEITGNSSAVEIDMGSLGGAGDVTLEDNGTNAVVSLTSLTNYGCGTNEVTMTLEGGTVLMTNGLTLCSNATLAGSTTIDGSITNNGTIEPGSSPGRLNITGNLHLGASSRLNLEIGGFAQGESDMVNVGGNTILGGMLNVRLLNSFTKVMTNGASFTVVTSGNPLNGSFENVASGATLTTEDGRGRFTVRYVGESTLRLTEFEILSGNTDLRVVASRPQSAAIRIAWNSISGKRYRVESTADLDSPFTDESPLIEATGVGEATLHFDTSVQSGTAARFYRVRIVE